LSGRQAVTFVNRTGRASDLRFHLYLNALAERPLDLAQESKEGSRRRPKGKDAEWFGWIEINRSLADGTDLTFGLTAIAPDDGTSTTDARRRPAPTPCRPGRDGRCCPR
jgi:hypothetical protein